MANLLGCVAYELFNGLLGPSLLRFVALVGFCGSVTTMSSFCADIHTLFAEKMMTADVPSTKAADKPPGLNPANVRNRTCSFLGFLQFMLYLVGTVALNLTAAGLLQRWAF